VDEELELPQLRDPWMVAAFDGWNDAADAATGVVDHLIEQWDAELLVELDPEDFYVFTEHHLRPQVHHVDAHGPEPGGRFITWPTPRLFVAHPKRSERDVLLLRAPEPSVRWKSFCAAFLDVAHGVGVTELYTIGALLADAPHTHPVPVSASTNDARLAGRLSADPSRYSGPVGITTILTDLAGEQGIATASIWGAVPHYLAEPPCPRVTLALLRALEDAVELSLPEGVLVELAEAWQRGADDAVADDQELAAYVRELENDRETSELPEASGDAIAREFERYLRHRGEDD